MLRRLADEGVLEKNEVDALVARIVAFRRQRQTPPPIPESPPPIPFIEAELQAPAVEPLMAAIVATPSELPVPRKSLGEVLTEFMAPHNIRWGEIIGGLLFVVGAAALVITQWETLQHLRYFRFVIAMAVSAAVFGLGLYSHYRWKLAATSRGLLTIATLLVPLNFLNLAGMAKDDPFWITAALEIAAAGLFAALLSFSAQVLVPGGRARQVVAVLGFSLVALWLARRFDPHAGLAWLSLAGCLPVALAAGASGSYLWSAARRARLAPQRAVAVFHLLGSAAFAACIALGVLAFRIAEASHWSAAVDGLSAAAELAGAALLLLGLTIRRRLRSGDRAEPHRLAAMWIALTGGLLMLAALGMAWPRPELLLLTAAFAAITLLTAALWFAVPALHIGAQASAAVAYVVAFLLASGTLAGVAEHDLGRAMLRGALGAPCGAALAGLVALLAAIGEILCRRRRAADGLVYSSGAGIVAAVSLAIVSAAHPLDPLRATVVCALYGLGALALNVRLLRPALTYVGSALLAGAALWWAKDHVTQPWSMAFLAHATAVGLAACGLRVTVGAVDAIRRAFIEPLGHTSLVSSVAALAAMFLFPWQSTSAAAAALLWLSLIWLAIAWVHRWPVVFAAHQAALAAAVATWLYGVYDGHFHAERPINLLQAWFIALGLLVLGWTLLRIALRRNHAMHRLLSPGWPMFDQVLKHALAPLQLAALAPTLIVGVQREFGGILPTGAAAQFWLSPVGQGAWLALAALGVTLVVSLWDRWRPMELFDAMVLAAACSCLLAARCLPAGPLASALRWTLSAAFVVVSIGVWLRNPLARRLRALGAHLRLRGLGARIARPALLALLLAPAVALTAAAFLDLFTGARLFTPSAGFFARLSPTVSYVAPLALLALGLVGHALRERSAGYVFSAGLLVESAVALGYLVVLRRAGVPPTHADLIAWVQWVSVATGAWTLGWLAARQYLGLWTDDPQQRSPGQPLLALQTTLAVAGNLALLGVYTGRLFTGHGLDHCTAFAHAPGWLALLLALAAVVWCLRQLAPERLGHAPGAILLGLVTLGSALALPHVAEHPFVHLYVYAYGLAAGSLLVLGTGFLWQRHNPSSPIRLAPAAIEGWTVLLAVLAAGCGLLWCGDDPRGPWPLAAAALTAGLALGLLACWRDKAQYVFASIALTCTAGSAVWLAKHHNPSLALVSVNVVCLSLSAAVWTLLELLRPGAVPKLRDQEGDAPVAWYALGLAALALGAAVLWGIRATLLPLVHVAASPVGVAPLDWYAWGSLALAMTLQLWDRSARRAWEGLYAVALLGLGLALLARRFAPDAFCWWSGLTLAGFVAATSAAACALPRLRRLGEALRIPPDRPFAPTAFATAQTALGATALALGLWISMDSRFNGLGARWLGNWSGRTGGAIALAELLIGAGFMAAAVGGAWRRFWQCAAIALAAILPAVLAWAQLSHDLALRGMHRQILLMTSTGLTALALALAVGRLIPAASDWAAAARRMIGPIGSLCAGLLAAILVQEAYWNLTAGSVPLTPWAIAAVAVTLLALTAGCVALAVSARPDPLGLSQRGRQFYVYAAEVLLVLIGVHLRLTAPELFRHHLIQRYGMFLVMGLAFLWTGLAEIFRRRERRVLAEPLAITARLLPLAAMVLFFLFGPDTPLVWFLIGLFYSVEAITRRSYWMGAAAVVTGNAGLWVLWQRMELGFLVHPQLWLIPLAVAALAAEHFSRKRLANGASAAVRGVALGVIYLSSSADMFIAGIGNSFWLPLILMLLAVAGVLCGMALRVRSFVYLGVSFVLLDLVAVLEYVTFERQQTWVFWSCIVLLGAAIIALFAVFEKRRDEIQAALARFRAWRP